MKGQTNFFVFAIIIASMGMLLSAQEISPLYMIGQQQVSPNTEALFFEYTVSTNEIQNISKFSYNKDYQSILSGAAIYYETGVYYGLFGSITDNQFTGHSIMSINTKTGEFEVEYANFTTSKVYSIAIDQSNGDLHFINSSYERQNDWWKINVNTGIMSLVKSNIYSNMFATISPMAYDSINETLWILSDDTLYGFNANNNSYIYKVRYPRTSLFSILCQLTINPKTSQLYAVYFDFHLHVGVNTTIYTVEFPSSSNHLSNPEFVPVCSYNYAANIFGVAYYFFDSDVDYLSNSLITMIYTSPSLTQSNANIMLFDLDTCSTTMTLLSDKKYFYGSPRFYPN